MISSILGVIYLLGWSSVGSAYQLALCSVMGRVTRERKLVQLFNLTCNESSVISGGGRDVCLLVNLASFPGFSLSLSVSDLPSHTSVYLLVMYHKRKALHVTALLFDFLFLKK